MNRILATVIAVGLASGLVGAFVYGLVSGDAGAAPPPPQAREDQITIFSDRQAGGEGGSFAPDSYFSIVWSPVVALDPGDYPANSTFRLEVTFGEFSTFAICLRLIDQATGVPVLGSELCHGAGGPVRHRSGTMQLATGEHEYRMQAKCVATSCSLDQWNAARIIAEWTERTR